MAKAWGGRKPAAMMLQGVLPVHFVTRDMTDPTKAVSMQWIAPASLRHHGGTNSAANNSSALEHNQAQWLRSWDRFPLYIWIDSNQKSP
eukprot:15350521-Ditylum_brightwellii.AAC.1